MNPTVKDVAGKAGVSTATVSRVLNEDPRITPSTTARVQQAIRELGYIPNPFARGLKTSRSLTVGFLAPEFANEVFMGIAQGVERRLLSDKFTLLIANSDENPVTERARLDFLLDRGVDGLIVIPAGSTGEHFAPAREQGIPIVLVDRLVSGFDTDAVLVDNANGTYRALEPYLQSGHRRIAFIGGNRDLTTAQERFEGYKRLLEDYRIPLEEDLVQFGDFHVESGGRLMARFLELPSPPPVVFISNRFMHLGATRFLMEQGIPPSQAPVLVSFDELDLAFSLGYCRTIVRQPIGEIGRQAAEFLLSRMNSEAAGQGPRMARMKTEVLNASAG